MAAHQQCSCFVQNPDFSAGFSWLLACCTCRVREDGGFHLFLRPCDVSLNRNWVTAYGHVLIEPTTAAAERFPGADLLWPSALTVLRAWINWKCSFQPWPPRPFFKYPTKLYLYLWHQVLQPLKSTYRLTVDQPRSQFRDPYSFTGPKCRVYPFSQFEL